MRTRREMLFGSIATIVAATGLSAPVLGKAGPLEVTYYYLPG